MNQKYLLLILVLFPLQMLSADKFIQGKVVDEHQEPLTGANVYWEGTQIGRTTDSGGHFSLEKTGTSHTLVVSYTGFATKKIEVQQSDTVLQVQLSETLELKEVVVKERSPGLISSRLSTVQTQKITRDELSRAACCNLAESFETNPSVDVAYTDATTGAKQIRLLGLSGTYIQMLTENFPNFRGVAAPYGLDYVPGPWLESIYISKGTSSVKNGYEAIAGQINVEFKKPKPTTDIFSANLFAADNQRFEMNTDATVLLSKSLSTTILGHFSSEEKEYDMIADGFLDTPLKRQFNLMNRWEYTTGKYIGQYGVRFLNENRKGGQTSDVIVPPDSLYRTNAETNRIEGFAKNGFILSTEKNESVALIVSGSYHEQKTTYGFRPYNVYETNLYTSLMYETNLMKEHRISTGISLNYDYFNENYILELPVKQASTKTFDQTKEITPGVYAEYTFNKDNRLIISAGLRADYSSLYDFFVTPRIHIKYDMTNWLHLRASAGKGFRTAHVLPENNFYMASNRKLNIASDLNMEEAWNYGANVSFYIPAFGKELTLNTEWYYTDFRKQVVIDLDSDPHAVSFYNLDGKSYSSNFQVELSYPFFRGLTATTAYRFTNVKTTYNGVLKKKPFTNDYKALATVSYQTPLKKWQFDITAQFNGGGHLPEPDQTNPLWNNDFSAFTILNAQVTKYFRTWSIYAGAENILDFVQKNPIIDPQHPWGDNFDSSIVWGPLHGRKFYVGLRYNIPRL